MRIRKITRAEVENLISIDEMMDPIKKAFRAKALDGVQMPPKSYVYFKKYDGDFRSMPAYIEDEDVAGVKIVNVHPQNPQKYGMESVSATIMLLNPKNGAPISLMDGTLITKIRTAVAAAIAAESLARKNSKVVSIIGAGAQARVQLIALEKIMDIREVRVIDKRSEKAEKFSEELSEKLNLDIKSVRNMKEAVIGSDVVVTVTPCRKPLIMNDWVREGMHINAIGADAPEKQELDSNILKRAKIVVDDWKQASHSGEISVPYCQGVISKEDIYSELGDIVAGKMEGRTSDDEITVFDSTGLAIQDIAAAWKVFQKAEERDIGAMIDF